MTFFIIPGFGQKTSDPVWRKIKKIAEKSYKEVVMVQPSWRNHTLTDWVNDFNVLSQKYPKPYVVLGFSFGAMTAFVSGIHIAAEKQILCSLSPYFAEDLASTRGWWAKIIGKKRMQEFTKYNFKSLAAQSKAKTWLLLGEKEVPECFVRFEKAKKLMPHWQTRLASAAKHDIGNEAYLKLLEQVIADSKA